MSRPWRPFGPFLTLGASAWIAWLIAAVAAAVGYGRAAVTMALLMTVALIPAAALTGYPRPPLFVVLPQIALGCVALAVPRRRWHPALLAGAAVAAAVGVMALLFGETSHYYGLLPVLQYGGLAVSLTLLGAGVVFVARGDGRAWWPAVILLGPVLLLFTAWAGRGQTWPTMGFAAGWTLLSVIVAAGVLQAALALVGSRRRAQTTRCDP